MKNIWGTRGAVLKYARITCFAILVSAAFCPAARGGYVEFPSGGFVLNKPDTWVRVPPDIFREKMRNLAKAQGKEEAGEIPGYDYALQRESGKWFSYPYTLISVWEDTRVDPDEITRMNRRVKENMLKQQNAVENPELVREGYDPARRFYRAHVRFEVAGNPLEAVKGVLYMNRSVVVLSSYCLQGEKARRDLADAERIMDSIRPAESNVYREEDSGGWNFKKDILPYFKVIIAAGIGLLIIGIYIFKQKRKGD